MLLVLPATRNLISAHGLATRQVQKPMVVLVVAAYCAGALSMQLLPTAMPHTSGRIIDPRTVAWTGVSHDPNIRKQVLLRNGEVPRLTGLSRSVFLPGQLAPEHSHPDMHEVFHVVRGSGTFRIDDVLHPVHGGTTVSLAPGQRHEINNSGNSRLELLYFGIELLTRG